jgi:hypothetical protein
VKPAYRGGFDIESLSSIGLLELLAPCGGIPDILAPAICLIELVPPCGDMPELVASWEMTVLSKFVPTCESLCPVDSLADPGWLELRERFLCEISSSHGGEYDVQNCLLGCTAV